MMLSRRGWSRATPATAQMRTTAISLICLHVDMIMRLVAPVQLHLYHRLTPLYFPYLRGSGSPGPGDRRYICTVLDQAG